MSAPTASQVVVRAPVYPKGAAPVTVVVGADGTRTYRPNAGGAPPAATQVVMPSSVSPQVVKTQLPVASGGYAASPVIQQPAATVVVPSQPTPAVEAPVFQVQFAPKGEKLLAKETFALKGPLFSASLQANFTFTFFDVSVPIHITCMLFGADGSSHGSVYYGTPENDTSKIKHTRQFKESGEMADTELLDFNPSAISPQVHHLLFMASTTSTFKEAGQVRVALNSGQTELCFFEPETPLDKTNAICLAHIQREGSSSWIVEASGLNFTVTDPGPCRSLVTQFGRICRLRSASAPKVVAKSGGPTSFMRANSVLLKGDLLQAALKFHTSWTFKSASVEVPVHTNCMKFGARSEFLGGVYYGNKEDADNKISHQRDYKDTGAMADHETLSLVLNNIEPQVRCLFFVASTTTSFDDIGELSSSLLMPAKELHAAQQQVASMPAKTNAIAMAMLYRKQGDWMYSVLGGTNMSYTGIIEDVGPCQKFVPQLSAIAKTVVTR